MLDRPVAQFFNDGFPANSCSQSFATLRFDADTLAVTCYVSDGIVDIDFRDAGPMESERRSGQILAVGRSGFSIEAALSPDSLRLDGLLVNRRGETQAVLLLRTNSR